MAGGIATEAHERTRPSTVRPSAAARSSAATTMAAAPSLIPDELPAVTVASGSSGCSTGSDASFSNVVSALGCSSASNIVTLPSTPTTGTGTISSANLPASRAAAARRFDVQCPFVGLGARDAGNTGGVLARR